MHLPHRPLTAILIVAVIAGETALVPAEATAAAACPARSVCDSRLGVQLSLPRGWIRLPGVPVSEIDLAKPGAGASGYLRLVIRAYAVTSDTRGSRALEAAVSQLTTEYPHHGTVTRRRVRYDAAPGLLLRGLLPTPQPAADFLLVHNRAVYLVIAPGSQLAPDQRRALSGLHFTPHASSFPVQPHLGVQPNPVNLGKKLRVTLTAVQPGVRYTFAIRPGKPGFGGGNMGARRSNIIGGVSFTYPPFRDRRDSGQWTMTAYNRNGQKVATTTVIVRATPCCAKDSRQKKTDQVEA